MAYQILQADTACGVGVTVLDPICYSFFKTKHLSDI